MANLPASQLLAAGRQYIQAGHDARGISVLQQALASEPDSFPAHSLLGFAYHTVGNWDAAITHLHRALSLNTAWAEGHELLGLVFAEKGNYQQAAEAFEKVVRLNPQNADALNNLGTTLRPIGRVEEAAAHLRAALVLRPESAEIRYNLAATLLDAGQTDLALDNFQRAVALKPDAVYLYHGLGNALLASGRAPEAVDCFRHGLKLDPSQDRIHSSLLMALHYTDSANHDPQSLFQEHRAFEKIHVPSPTTPRPKPYASSPGRRLRIGYFSPDFRRHSVAFFIEPILSHHDKNHFDIVCYADVATPDAITARFSYMVSLWRNVHGQTDAQVAQQVHADQIDILIDLAGHTGGGRPRLFGLKPAPVQISYLGYPNTTGLESIDYRLTDRIADPPGDADLYHVEKLVRLDPVFLCYQPPIDAPQVTAPPAAQNGFVTFGSFNNLAKITPATVQLWSKLIRAVPRSRLLLKARGLQNVALSHALADSFHAQGIDRDRLFFQGHTTQLSDHLACYGQLDIALDPVAYNGTTTTCEALWMGVPVITLAGQTHRSRIGATLLSSVGHREWIAGNSEEFMRLGISLVSDPEHMKNIRRHLRHQLRAGPITDGQGFTRGYEIALQQIWQESRQKTVDSSVCTGL
jgi:protein O-GlcNAc transferase